MERHFSPFEDTLWWATAMSAPATSELEGRKIAVHADLHTRIGQHLRELPAGELAALDALLFVKRLYALR